MGFYDQIPELIPEQYSIVLCPPELAPADINTLVACKADCLQLNRIAETEQLVKSWLKNWKAISRQDITDFTRAAEGANSAKVDAGHGLQIKSFEESFEIDVVVPFFLTSLNTAERIHSLRKYIRPKVRNVFFLVESDVSCSYLRSLATRNYCIPMHALSGISSSEIDKKYPELGASGRRGGWFIQQFAKLFISLVDIGLSDYYIIIDSDNLFLKPFEVLEKVSVKNYGLGSTVVEAPTSQFFLLSPTDTGKFVPTLVTKKYEPDKVTVRARFFAGKVSEMWFRDYGPTTFRLLGTWPALFKNGRTAVPHWMAFSKLRTQELVDILFTNSQATESSPFYDTIFSWAAQNRSCSSLAECKQMVSSLSEYQLYSTFMMSKYPEEVFFDETSLNKYARNPPNSFSIQNGGYRCWVNVTDLKHRYPRLIYVTLEDEKFRFHNTCSDVKDYINEDSLLSATLAAENEVLLDRKVDPFPFHFEYNHLHLARSRSRLVISVWHVFHKPPWGGGNQFLMALVEALKRQIDTVAKVQLNEITKETNAIIINAHTFDVKEFDKSYNFFFGSAVRSEKPFVVAHRIDGPNIVNRANTKSYQRQDRIVQTVNNLYADISIHQSIFSWLAWDRTYESHVLGGGPEETETGSTRLYRPRYIIRNAADPAIFQSLPPCTAGLHSPVRLVATSWSNGIYKGSDTLQALSETIDCSEFHLTFVGTRDEKFPLAEHRRCVTIKPPQDSTAVAKILSEHDIFIAASRQEPASNSLIEAIALGLPVAFRDEGGHPEAVGLGGARFETDPELLDAIRKIVANYTFYKSVVGAPLHRDIDGIARQYADVLLGYSPGARS